MAVQPGVGVGRTHRLLRTFSRSPLNGSTVIRTLIAMCHRVTIGVDKPSGIGFAAHALLV